jgi:hypothetical protein
MALQIRTTAQPYYSERVRLDGRDYVLRFAWNEREERWYLSFLTGSEEPILMGIKLIANWPLLDSYRFDTRLPAGEIYCVDWTSDGTPPLLDELGDDKRCQLLYFAPDELATIFPS